MICESLKARLNYIGWNNLMDVCCFVMGLLLVVDWSSCRHDTGIREDWQWQVRREREGARRGCFSTSNFRWVLCA